MKLKSAAQGGSNRAVVLLSGGVDSSTTMAIAKAEGYKVYALSFNYEQRHGVELAFAKRLASSLKTEKHLVTALDLREIGGSALTADIEVPKENVETQMRGGLEVRDFPEMTSQAPTERAAGIPVTYVPARNTIFLSVALAWAEVLEAESIFIGANAVDYSGYPDCRPEYLRAFEEMANLATKVSVEGRLKFRIKAPVISLRKSEIIRKGMELGLDYSLTWSCYDPQFIVRGEEAEVRRAVDMEKFLSSDIQSVRTIVRPCGRCDSCRLREKGFREAGVEDPGSR